MVIQPHHRADPQFLDALRQLVGRIAAAIGPFAGVIRMVVAGGVAVHVYTGSRFTKDVDASFSTRILLPDGAAVAYQDAGGESRVLFLDMQYNDTFALLHEDALEDAWPLYSIPLEKGSLDVAVLTPTDLAISKMSRLAGHDREDIHCLAAAGLLDPKVVAERAESALVAYVGDTSRMRSQIRSAIEDIRRAIV
mgnify:FL=1